MNLIEIILAIVLIIAIVKPPNTFKRVVITNSGRLIFAFVVLYLALNHGKVIGVLSCLIFIVMLNNDILEGMKKEKTEYNAKNLDVNYHNEYPLSKQHLKKSDKEAKKFDKTFNKDWNNGSRWSYDSGMSNQNLKNGEWDNTECKRFLDKCSYGSLKVIRENAPKISRKYSYNRAKMMLDKLITENLHDCLRYAKKKCTNKNTLTNMYNDIMSKNSIDKKYTREDYRRFRSKNFARHAREDTYQKEDDACEINDFGEYYSTDDQYDSGSESDSGSSSSDSDSDSDSDNSFRKNKVKNFRVKNLIVDNIVDEDNEYGDSNTKCKK